MSDRVAQHVGTELHSATGRIVGVKSFSFSWLPICSASSLPPPSSVSQVYVNLYVVFSTSVLCSGTPCNPLTKPSLWTMMSLLSESPTACYTTYLWNSTNHPPSGIIGFMKWPRRSDFFIGAQVNYPLWHYVWGSRCRSADKSLTWPDWKKKNNW